jgi:syntaxin 18
MTAEDITPLFRSVMTSVQGSVPPGRPKSPYRARSPAPKGKQKDDQGEFLKEAYRIVRRSLPSSFESTARSPCSALMVKHAHLASLSTLLGTIRKAYLSTATAPIRRHERPHEDGSSGGQGGEDGLERWKDSKYLSDRERDEIDLRAKVILRRCRERVTQLEEQEKGGLSALYAHIPPSVVRVVSLRAARQKQASPPAVSALYTFLPSLAPAETSLAVGESLVTAHRASVIWTLNDMMARIGGTIAGMQEERLKRREERSRTLGGQASREAARFTSNSTSTSKLPSMLMPTSGTESKAVIPEDEPPIESQLSPEQIQQFALENNALVEHMESQLTSVLAAEKSLLEISALQTELVRHLAMQTEITERLYDEAVGSVAEVGKANQQLKQARKRGEEGRLFLLVFLIGASLALLFLDWYS